MGDLAEHGRARPALLVVAVAGKLVWLETIQLGLVIGRVTSNQAHWGYLATRSGQLQAGSFVSLVKRPSRWPFHSKFSSSPIAACVGVVELLCTVAQLLTSLPSAISIS